MIVKKRAAHNTVAQKRATHFAGLVPVDRWEFFTRSRNERVTTPFRSTSRSSRDGELAEIDIRSLLSASALVYPPAARNAGIELDHPVEIVVDTLGQVASARPITRAGYGLDEAALRAIAEYRFAPARRGGHPVRVRMRWIVQLRLR